MYSPLPCLLSVGLLGCAVGQREPTAARPVPSPLRLLAGPTFERPDAEVWFARWLVLETDRPTQVSLSLHAPDGEALHWSWPEVNTVHRLPVLQLLPDTVHVGEVEVVDDSGQALGTPVALRTAPVPAELPSIEVLAQVPERMEPGLTLMPMDGVQHGMWAAVLDANARYRWAMRFDDTVSDLRLANDGDLWMISGGGVQRMTLMGESVSVWWRDLEPPPGARSVEGTGAFHHDVVPRADGGFLTLSRTTRHVSDYPFERAPLGEGSDEEVMVPTVVEVDPDGLVEGEIVLGDLLDIRRISYDSRSESDLGFDWGHGNAVIRTGDGGYIVSLRHQDCLVKVRESGELVWILGIHDGWGPEHQPYLLDPVGEELRWPFHTHAPFLQDDGGLAVFDNGNHDRSTPYGEPADDPYSFSRVVMYDIDESNMTIQQRWSLEQTTTARVFSVAMGDADIQPTTGNVLAVYGMVTHEAGEQNTGARHHVRILEWSLDTPEDPVLDLRLGDHTGTLHLGWRVYRVQRLPRLHVAVAHDP